MEENGVVPTEDAVQALVDHLVYPLLPERPSFHEPPSISAQKSVATQMHAVVLLYNYYHRKQSPELEFLGFDSFCKVSVNARPSLLMHMKFMQKCNDKSGNLDKQFSITEEMVMEACNISKELDACKEAPDIGGWPVSKVSVLVVDSMKKNCLLQFSSIVKGVWSLLEKNLDVPVSSVKPWSSGNQSVNGQSILEKVAFSAVKEKTGIDQRDLTILEQHHVYSLSKEKAAAQFYLMQCNKLISEAVFQVPIKDAISSLQGLLVKRCKDGCIATSVVEYFHLLPYATILSDWFYRVTSADSSRFALNCSRNGGDHWTPMTEKLGKLEDGSSSDRSDHHEQTLDLSEIDTEMINKAVDKEGYDGHQRDAGSVSRLQPMVDKCSLPCPGKRPSDAAATTVKNIQETQFEKRKKPLVQNGSKATGAAFKEKAGVGASSSRPCVKVKHSHNISSVNGATAGGQPHRPSDPNYQHLDKVKVVLASKGNELLQTALRVLQKKQDELSHQHRQLADEIAQCEKNIRAIARGGEDCLALEIESIIEACNTTMSKGSQGRGSCDVRRKRLAEAVLLLRTPCQELDEICSENNWVLPRYSVSPTIGGFIASVIVQGMDFEFSGSGEEQKNPREAREAAATAMISKLRSMASQLH